MSAAQRRATRERLAEEARQERIRRAGPQLLAALEQVESLLGGLADKEFENQHAANKSATAYDLARAAIAAARGES